MTRREELLTEFRSWFPGPSELSFIDFCEREGILEDNHDNIEKHLNDFDKNLSEYINKVDELVAFVKSNCADTSAELDKIEEFVNDPRS